MQVLAAIVETGKRASEVCRVFEAAPQLLRNVRFGQGQSLVSRQMKQAIAEAEDQRCWRGGGRHLRVDPGGGVEWLQGAT